ATANRECNDAPLGHGAAVLLGIREWKEKHPLVFPTDVFHYNYLPSFDVELNYDELSNLIVESKMSDFVRLLEMEIPRLRRYARALTRDVSRADDLLQNRLTRALAKQHLWQPGTNLRAWLFTIQHHQHVNDVRRSIREGSHVMLDEARELTVQANAIPTLQLRDLAVALGKLQPEQRQVIL